MNGSPFTLPKADYNLCWAACNTTAGCTAWAYAIPKCDGYDQPTCWLKSGSPTPSSQSCRVSGAQATVTYTGDPLAAAAVYDLGSVAPGVTTTRYLTFAVDEILAISWFGEAAPPYWRRNLPLNDSTVVPLAMLAESHVSYPAVRALCNGFDNKTGEYATVTMDGLLPLLVS